MTPSARNPTKRPQLSTCPSDKSGHHGVLDSTERTHQEVPSVTRLSVAERTLAWTAKDTRAVQAPPFMTLASHHSSHRKIDNSSSSNATPSTSNSVKRPRLSTQAARTERLVAKISYKIDMKDPKLLMVNEHCLVRVTPLSATHALESSAVSSLVQSRYVMTDVT